MFDFTFSHIELGLYKYPSQEYQTLSAYKTDQPIYPKYSDKQSWANRVDPGQTPQNAASNQGLRCLPLFH